MPSTPLLAAVLPSADCREQGPWRQHPAAQALHHRGHQSQHVMVLALQQLLLPLQPLLLLLAAVLLADASFGLIFASTRAQAVSGDKYSTSDANAGAGCNCRPTAFADSGGNAAAGCCQLLLAAGCCCWLLLMALLLTHGRLHGAQGCVRSVQIKRELAS